MNKIIKIKMPVQLPLANLPLTQNRSEGQTV